MKTRFREIIQILVKLWIIHWRIICYQDWVIRIITKVNMLSSISNQSSNNRKLLRKTVFWLAIYCVLRGNEFLSNNSNQRKPTYTAYDGASRSLETNDEHPFDGLMTYTQQNCLNSYLNKIWQSKAPWRKHRFVTTCNLTVVLKYIVKLFIFKSPLMTSHLTNARYFDRNISNRTDVINFRWYGSCARIVRLLNSSSVNTLWKLNPFF